MKPVKRRKQLIIPPKPKLTDSLEIGTTQVEVEGVKRRKERYL
jgi:hypothetical protein